MSKKNGKVNVISRVLHDARKSKEFVGLTVRLKKDGTWRKINGQIYDLKLNQDGAGYVVMQNFFAPERKDGKRWQSVSMDNIVSVRANKKTYR